MKNSTVKIQDVTGQYQSVEAQEVLRAAREYAEEALTRPDTISNPREASELVTSLIQNLEHEVFYAIWLDSQHKVIGAELMSRGTIDEASVYPREIVKSALRHNAAAVIFAHNHPSGSAEPSGPDRTITNRLKKVLGFVTVSVLDHLVVGATVSSFAELGLL